MYDDNNPRDLVNEIAVSLAYYGLLLLSEVIGITKKDINLDMTDDVEIDYPYETKCSAKGFSFKVPEWIKGFFRKYLEQFTLSSENDCRFLKNWSKKKDGRGRI